MAKTLKPWYAVATPHEDIRKGRLEEAVFAANIWAVVQETAPEVYLDPEEFFRKSFMTEGLGAILSRVARALSGGDAGDRILSLQTSFGGGKTHTLVALWHMAKHAERLKKSPAGAELRVVLGSHLPKKAGRVAVFTNATCDATQGRKTPEGVHTRTLWGELAVQLGGRKLYEKIRANDESQRVPQGLFADVLREAAPCLILMDELADYCVGAAGVKVGDTTLADQTISFIQQLTEAVQQVPGVVVVATLPASKYEVAGSEEGQEAFVSLEKRFQRLGADVKPVADHEINSVVRARLFESVTSEDEADYPLEVAKTYQAMYAEHAGEVPADATKASYRDQIERSYPFHPILIDALFTRWGGHPDFQRTRGVLRLLASVVGDLWNHREGNTRSMPLIQPCHLRWSVDALQAQLTRLWGPGFQAVVAADVLGEKSNANAFDEERGGDYLREGLGEGLAAAVLLGSFGGQGQKSGFSAKDLKVACARPGLNWAYTDGTLLELENRCFYLHDAAAGSLGKRYWFGTKPTLNRLVVQYRQQAAKNSFDQDIVDALSGEAKGGPLGGATWRVLVNPEKDLPEQKALTLLVLPPSLAWDEGTGGADAVRKRVVEISSRCGERDRTYRNTLVFLAPSSRGLSKLRQAHRERAALRGVEGDYGAQLDVGQKDDLKKRLDVAEKSASEALGPAYTVALRVHGAEVEVVSLSDARTRFAEHLGYVWTVLVDDEEWILKRVGSVTLQKTGLIPKPGESLRLHDAIDAFLRFTDKPQIAFKDAVTAGLVQACRDGLIGIGRGPTAASLQARYCRETILLDASEEGIWVLPPFERETPADNSTIGTTVNGGAAGSARPAVGGTSSPPARGPGASGPSPGRRIERIVIRGAVPAENWSDLFRSFVNPATKMRLHRLRFGVEFEMEPGPGGELYSDDSALKAMREAAHQLGLNVEETLESDLNGPHGGR